MGRGKGGLVIEKCNTSRLYALLLIPPTKPTSVSAIMMLF
jgi:hypothetical protein